MSEPNVVTITTYEAARDAFRHKQLRQALYDAGEVVMADVLVNLHGEAHRARRRLENRLFRRDSHARYERDLFPPIVAETLAPHVEQGRAELVGLSHQMMMNLAAFTAGVDRPQGTPEETFHLYSYMMRFIEGATLAHYTGDREAKRAEVAAALESFDGEFLQPSIARRLAALARSDAGEITEDDLPRDVLTVLLRNRDDLELPAPVVLRETCFYLLAGAHTSATAFVRALHAIFAMADIDLRDGQRVAAGDKVVIDLMAANRDPSVFGADADRFDPHRELPDGVGRAGLSFGSGMHACIGQELAAGVESAAAPDGDQLYGLVPVAVQAVLRAGARPDPQDPPRLDPESARGYWATYPVVFTGPPRG
jgi:cytochrome P450